MAAIVQAVLVGKKLFIYDVQTVNQKHSWILLLVSSRMRDFISGLWLLVLNLVRSPDSRQKLLNMESDTWRDYFKYHKKTITWTFTSQIAASCDGPLVQFYKQRDFKGDYIRIINFSDFWALPMDSRLMEKLWWSRLDKNNWASCKALVFLAKDVLPTWKVSMLVKCWKIFFTHVH